MRWYPLAAVTHGDHDLVVLHRTAYADREAERRKPHGVDQQMLEDPRERLRVRPGPRRLELALYLVTREHTGELVDHAVDDGREVDPFS